MMIRFLMPPDPRDWLPTQHLAWAVRPAAGELDLAPFLAAHRADGQGPGRGSPQADAGKLARRTAAQAKLEAGEQTRRQQAEAERAGKIAKLAAEKDRLEARAAEELAKGQARVARYEQRAAAAAAGRGRWQRGRAPGRRAAARRPHLGGRGRGRAGRAQTGRGGRRPCRGGGSGPPAQGEHH